MHANRDVRPEVWQYCIQCNKPTARVIDRCSSSSQSNWYFSTLKSYPDAQGSGDPGKMLWFSMRLKAGELKSETSKSVFLVKKCKLILYIRE